MTWIAAPVTCPNDPGIWEHVNGWEVVCVVLVTATGWATVSIARFHYMAVVARIGNHETPPTTLRQRIKDQIRPDSPENGPEQAD